MKLKIECYEITARIIIRKNYLDQDITKEQIISQVLKERIQQGLEIPCESINVEVKE